MRLSAGLVAVQAEALDAQSHRSCTCSWNNKNVGVLTLERHDLRESWVLLGVGHQRPFGYDAAWYGKLLYCSSRKFLSHEPQLFAGGFDWTSIGSSLVLLHAAGGVTREILLYLQGWVCYSGMGFDRVQSDGLIAIAVFCNVCWSLSLWRRCVASNRSRFVIYGPCTFENMWTRNFSSGAFQWERSSLNISVAVACRHDEAHGRGMGPTTSSDFVLMR